MEKKKIAESIIIRVGDGIREVYREPLDIPEVIDTYNVEAESPQSEDLSALRSKSDSVSSNPEETTLN